MTYQDDEGNWEGCALTALAVLVAALLLFAHFAGPT